MTKKALSLILAFTVFALTVITHTSTAYANQATRMARQDDRRCRGLVKAKGLKEDQSKSEFLKCKEEGDTYK
jgi:hypothetical protein